ncbi:hypothetical protein TWF730_009220 [Orbilia blumenaviensis]|uniref:Uncharacterized protein n=1 Tax=Orbilia blumenaviensis TaxID=1796055 RepID=A0AAV9V1N3_9PEZI
MRQLDVVPGNKISDYQNALNNVPFSVKQQYPAYRWVTAPNFDMGWKSMSNNGREGRDTWSNDCCQARLSYTSSKTKTNIL